MRESLICIGKIGKKGYYFEDTGIQIFSYEELCYYLKRHMICYIHTLPGEDLLVYLRDELGLEKLYKQLIRLTDPEKDQMKYFSALFREGHYFNEDEIRDILDEYRSLMNAPVYRQKKWMGDLLVRSGRSARALESYQEALAEDKDCFYQGISAFRRGEISFLLLCDYGIVRRNRSSRRRIEGI